MVSHELGSIAGVAYTDDDATHVAEISVKFLKTKNAEEKARRSGRNQRARWLFVNFFF